MCVCLRLVVVSRHCKARHALAWWKKGEDEHNQWFTISFDLDFWLWSIIIRAIRLWMFLEIIRKIKALIILGLGGLCKAIWRRENPTVVSHLPMERIGRTGWFGEVMANKSNSRGEPIASRSWTYACTQTHITPFQNNSQDTVFLRKYILLPMWNNHTICIILL